MSFYVQLMKLPLNDVAANEATTNEAQQTNMFQCSVSVLTYFNTLNAL